MVQDKDIEFALAVLNADYKKRRNALLQCDPQKPNTQDGLLTDLENLKGAIIKIECAFKGGSHG